MIRTTIIATLLFLASAAEAQPRDTVNVDSKKSTTTFSSIVLKSCAEYRLEAKGKYTFAQDFQSNADAQYCYECYYKPTPTLLPPPNFFNPLFLSINDTSFRADSSASQPDYRSSHIYYMTIRGDDKPFRTKIYDTDTTNQSHYADNTGAITIVIQRKTQELVLSRDTIDFGTVNVGTNQQQSVWLYNRGYDTLRIDSLKFEIQSSSITKSHKALPFTIAGGDSEEVRIAFVPYGNGNYFSRILLWCDDSTCVSAPRSIVILGKGTGATTGPQCVINPPSLEFGTVNVGAPPAQLQFSLRNVGDSTLTITSVAFSGSSTGFLFTPPSTPFALAPAQARMFAVQFSPPVEGEFFSTIVVGSNSLPFDSALALHGMGHLRRAHLEFTPGAIDFGGVRVGQHRDTTVTLKNSGDNDASIDSVYVLGPGVVYRVSGRMNYVLKIDSSELYTLSFYPEDRIVYSTLVRIATGAAISDTIPVIGKGIDTLVASVAIDSTLHGRERSTVVASTRLETDLEGRNANGVSFDIEYDENLVALEKVTTFSSILRGDSMTLTHVAAGRSAVTVKDSTRISGTGVLLRLHYVVKQSLSPYFTPLTLSNFRFLGVDTIATQTRNGLLSIDTSCGTSLATGTPLATALRRPSPNPAHDDVMIEVDVRHESFIDADIIDAFGRTSQLFPRESLNEGVYRYRVDTRPVRSGMYMIRLWVNGALAGEQKLLVAH